MGKSIKGQLLFLVLFFLVIVGILSGGLLHMWESGVRLPSIHEHSLQAFYLAQAGLERAKVEVLNNVNLTGCQPGPSCDDDWYIDLDVFPADSFTWNYNFDIVIVAAGTQRTITARGQVLDSASNEVARREIQVTVDGIDDQYDNSDPTDFTPDGLDDDPSDNSVAAGTWQEI